MSHLNLFSERPVYAPFSSLEESERHFLARFDLPGVRREDIRVALKDNILTVKAQRKEEQRKSRKGRLFSSSYFGSYERSFTLPGEIRPDQIEANFSDGVLLLLIPKKKSAQPRKTPAVKAA